ncbi:MAG TPA: hypothetical protein VGJ36_09240 [Gemmatimonadales bacterium]
MATERQSAATRGAFLEGNEFITPLNLHDPWMAVNRRHGEAASITRTVMRLTARLTARHYR